MAKKAKFKAGDRVRTNDRLAKMFSDTPKPWTGAVVAPAEHIENSYLVRFDGVSRMQLINEKYLEAE